MQRFNKTMLLSAITSIGLAGSVSAGVLSVTDGGFEVVTSSGNAANDFYLEATNWFEQGLAGAGSGQTELFLSEARADTPSDSVGEFWATMIDRGTTSGVYQQVGTYASGDQLEYNVSYTIGDRSNQDFSALTFEFYSVSAGDAGTAADGTALVDAFSTETLIGTFTTSGLGGGASTASLSEVKNLTLSMPSDGDEVWLLIRQDTTGGEHSLVDNVGLTAVPEPGSLALLGLGGLAVARRRRRD